jgi:hypothetical protein
LALGLRGGLTSRSTCVHERLAEDACSGKLAEDGAGHWSKMGIYDQRIGPAYRPCPGTYYPGIAEWWTPEHDAAIETLIRCNPRSWHSKASHVIQQMTAPSVLSKWRSAHAKLQANVWYNAIMYHAIFRAEQLGLARLVPASAAKTCPLCELEFTEDSLPTPFVDLLGHDRINFCAPCLSARIGIAPALHDLEKSAILEYVRNAAGAMGRLPSQGFENDKSLFRSLSDEQRLALLRIMGNRPLIESVKRGCGSWFLALREAGLLDAGSRRLQRGTQCVADDGHVCFSLAEKTICDFLHERGVPHEKEPNYPEGRYRADFRIGGTLIEYLGLSGSPPYDQRVALKRDIARRHSIELIEILPEDVADPARLEARLVRLLGM